MQKKPECTHIYLTPLLDKLTKTCFFNQSKRKIAMATPRNRNVIRLNGWCFDPQSTGIKFSKKKCKCMSFSAIFNREIESCWKVKLVFFVDFWWFPHSKPCWDRSTSAAPVPANMMFGAPRISRDSLESLRPGFFLTDWAPSIEVFRCCGKEWKRKWLQIHLGWVLFISWRCHIHCLSATSERQYAFRLCCLFPSHWD